MGGGNSLLLGLEPCRSGQWDGGWSGGLGCRRDCGSVSPSTVAAALVPSSQPLLPCWGSLTPRDSHPCEHILTGCASGAPPAAPSSLCPREEPSSVLSPSRTRGSLRHQGQAEGERRGRAEPLTKLLLPHKLRRTSKTLPLGASIYPSVRWGDWGVLRAHSGCLLPVAVIFIV